MSRTLPLSLIAVLVLAAGPVAAREHHVPFDARDGRDRAVEAGVPEVRVDGHGAGPLELEPVRAEEGRVLLWFDRTLASGATLRRAAEALGRSAAALVEAGEVEVVLVDPEPEVLLSTRDPLTLEQRLGWLGIREGGASRLLEARQELLDRLPRLDERQRAEEIGAVVAFERERVERSLDALLARAGDERSGLRFALVVADGFDLDPSAAWAEPGIPAAPPSEAGWSDEIEARWRALASLGWVAWTFRPAGASDRVPELDAVRLDDPSGAGVSPTAGVVTVRPGSRKKDEEDAGPRAALVAGDRPLRALAEATGGTLIESESGLRGLVGRWADWRLGRLPADRWERVATGEEPVTLELEVEGAASVRAPRWIADSPGALAIARARRALAGGREGDLGVAAVVEEETSELEVRLDVDEEAADLRVVLVGPDGVEARTSGAPEDGRIVLALRDASIADEGAVVVERPSDGAWGVVRPAVVRAPEIVTAERGPVVRLQRPDRDVFAGKVELSAEVWAQEVARVEFLVDDAVVGTADEAPWTVRVDFGRSRERRRVTLVAYDGAGEELGRDAVLVNAGAGALGVRLVRPESTSATGWVEAEASVEVPIERRLDRVVVYWNAEPVATLHDPPFVARVRIPEDRPMGYIRALALLDDGTVAEDVVFMNGPRSGERVDVHLVELYVVVTDEDGRPVRGLGREAFRLIEGGREQEIADFAEAEDLPLTLGMAIDSSASMFVKLPRMQRAAARFLRSTFREPRDRAFVVDFDSEPRLARAMTDDLDAVIGAVDSLMADGRTALWESVVYSLVQLQGVAGRKALVVFSDGADEDDGFPFRSCLQVARRMGVPVYLIFLRDEPEEGVLSLLTRSLSDRVDRLVAATGGRVFWTGSLEDLDRVYAEIERELRSQYLLTYYPEDPPEGGSWRDVDVEVEGDGLEPRTLSGYWP